MNYIGLGNYSNSISSQSLSTQAGADFAFKNKEPKQAEKVSLSKDVFSKDNNKTATPETRKHHRRKKHKHELLDSKPVYISSYANELGAALSPLPGIGNKLFLMSWVPVLMYLGADVNSKYEEIRDNKTYNPCKSNAVELVVFEEFASSTLSTIAVIAGQKLASRLSRVASNDKMDVRAKDDVVKELKRDLNLQKMIEYKDKIYKALADKTNTGELSQSEDIKVMKNNLTQSIFEDIKRERQSLNQHKKSASFLRKILDHFVNQDKICKHVARFDDNKFEQVVKPYLAKQVSTIVDSRIELQKILNPDGTINETAKNVDAKLLKKAKKLLKRANANRDIIDKCNYVLQEHSMSKLNALAYKHSLIKMAGGIAALILFAVPIDKFISVVFTPKGVQFDREKLKKTFPAFDLNIKLQ